MDNSIKLEQFENDESSQIYTHDHITPNRSVIYVTCESSGQKNMRKTSETEWFPNYFCLDHW